MNAPPASWSQPLSRDPARVLVTAGLAIAAFVAVWFLIHHGFYRDRQIVDTPIYQRYGDAIAKGQVPYRDFALEYPPGALPAFAIPAVLTPGTNGTDYREVFEWEMLVCGALVLTLMLSILLRLGAGRARTFGALAFAVLAPLLLGSVVLSRFDLWPALLVVAALAALVSDRNRLGGAALGLAIAAKIYPAVLVPVLAVWVWRRAGRREALVCLGVLGGVLLAIFLPFVVLSPHGVWHSLTTQTSRPLQIETLGSGVLLVLHAVAGLGVTMRSSHGSQNLAGDGPDALAALQTIAQAAAVIAVWIWFARGPADRDRLVRAFAAAVCAFIAFGKVLSPQFLIWLVPLVPLVVGRRGLAAGGLLAAALLATQLWFPFRYWDLVFQFRTFPSFMVLLRDLLLVALFAVLLSERRFARPRSP
jgi:Glycosyltransferase family 87